MKREKFIRELLKSGCEFHRHGGWHDIYVHLASGKKTAVPRHPEIKDDLCKLIRRQLGWGWAKPIERSVFIKESYSLTRKRVDVLLRK